MCNLVLNLHGSSYTSQNAFWTPGDVACGNFNQVYDAFVESFGTIFGSKPRINCFQVLTYSTRWDALNGMHALVILIAMDAKFYSGHGTCITVIVDVQWRLYLSSFRSCERRNEPLKTRGQSASGMPLDSNGFDTVMCGV